MRGLSSRDLVIAATKEVSHLRSDLAATQKQLHQSKDDQETYKSLYEFEKTELRATIEAYKAAPAQPGEPILPLSIFENGTTIYAAAKAISIDLCARLPHDQHAVWLFFHAAWAEAQRIADATAVATMRASCAAEALLPIRKRISPDVRRASVDDILMGF